jgi:hypothetical protein
MEGPRIGRPHMELGKRGLPQNQRAASRSSLSIRGFGVSPELTCFLRLRRPLWRCSPESLLTSVALAAVVPRPRRTPAAVGIA